MSTTAHIENLTDDDRAQPQTDARSAFRGGRAARARRPATRPQRSRHPP